VPPQCADVHLAARAALRVLEIETRAERIGATGEHHDGRLGVVLEASSGPGELTQRLRRESIDAIATIKSYDGNAPIRPETSFERD
jgi:hypothetical protein